MKKAIIGIGGGGQNIINYFYEHNSENLRLICINSDEQILNMTNAEKWLLGNKIAVFGNDNFMTRLLYKLLKWSPFYRQSLGCGGNVQTGEMIIKRYLKRIKKELQTMDEVVIVSTFGGGFGTGATPILVKTAMDMNIRTKVFVTTPLIIEGKLRMNNALCGIAQLKKYLSDVHVISNQDLFDNASKEISLKNALDSVSQKIYKMVV